QVHAASCADRLLWRFLQRLGQSGLRPLLFRFGRMPAFEYVADRTLRQTSRVLFVFQICHKDLCSIIRDSEKLEQAKPGQALGTSDHQITRSPDHPILSPPSPTPHSSQLIPRDPKLIPRDIPTDPNRYPRAIPTSRPKTPPAPRVMAPP